MSSAMAGLGVSLGPMMPETLTEVVGCLPSVVREHELLTARRAVHQVLAMFESHYQGLDCMALSATGPPTSLTINATSWRKTAPPSLATWPKPP
jgi:hypothetical protein